MCIANVHVFPSRCLLCCAHYGRYVSEPTYNNPQNIGGWPCMIHINLTHALGNFISTPRRSALGERRVVSHARSAYYVKLLVYLDAATLGGDECPSSGGCPRVIPLLTSQHHFCLLSATHPVFYHHYITNYLLHDTYMVLSNRARSLEELMKQVTCRTS